MNNESVSVLTKCIPPLNGKTFEIILYKNKNLFNEIRYLNIRYISKFMRQYRIETLLFVL